jgi:DNA-binding NarL/FixJ family response regulator
MYVLRSANQRHQEGCTPAEGIEGKVTPPGTEPPRRDDQFQESNAPVGWANGAPSRDFNMLVYIDTRAFLRDCVGRWLQSSLSGFRVWALPNAEEIKTAPIKTEQIRAVLINTASERMLSGSVAGLLSRLSELLPAVPVAVLSDYEDAENIREAFGLGVRGYIPNSMASIVAVEAMHLVCVGGTFAPPAALLSYGGRSRASADERPLIEGFTHRQTQILDCLRRGMANKLIAYELNMCENTVKVHVRNLMKKVNARNRTQVVYLTRGCFEMARQYQSG